MSISVQLIKEAAASHYGMTPNDLEGPWRQREIVHARQVAMYVARRLTHQSLPEIGRRFGNRDHTTVLHATRAIEARIHDDLGLIEEIEAVSKAVAVSIEPKTRDRLGRLAELLAPMIADELAKRQAETAPAPAAPVQPLPVPVPVPAKPEPVLMRVCREVVDADRALDNAQWGRGEAAARRRLESAVKALRKTLETLN